MMMTKCDIVPNQYSPCLEQSEHTAAFTGYRPYKLPQNCSAIVQTVLSQRLEEAVRKTYMRGYRIYLNGLMAGWDILAAEAVLALREELAGLCCVSIVPFRKSYFSNLIWTPEWKARALNVYRQSDLAFPLADQYRKGIYYERDRFLVSHATLMIAYYDGKPGGTKYTLDFAAQSGLEIINIASPQ